MSVSTVAAGAASDPKSAGPWLGSLLHVPNPRGDYRLSTLRKDFREQPLPPQALSGSRVTGGSRFRTPTVMKRWTGMWMVLSLLALLCLWQGAKVWKTAGSEGHPTTAASGVDITTSQTPKEVSSVSHNPVLTGARQISTLDSSLLPHAGQSTLKGRNKRLVFIGDIHGCYDELMQLLGKIEFDETADHIISTGDIVNKGPSSGAVIDFLAAHRASCVRGNHDHKILEMASPAPVSTDQGVDNEDSALRVARSLTTLQLDYLRSCPIILHVGKVSPHGDLVVVHGGLVPSIDLADQDPWAVMNMRIVHTLDHTPSKDHQREGFVPWAEMWNAYQGPHQLPATWNMGMQMLDVHLGRTVIYGHDAKQGLRLRKYSKGLDSGCVTGHELTALVLSSELEEEVYQVSCQKYA